MRVVKGRCDGAQRWAVLLWGVAICGMLLSLARGADDVAGETWEEALEEHGDGVAWRRRRW